MKVVCVYMHMLCCSVVLKSCVYSSQENTLTLECTMQYNIFVLIFLVLDNTLMFTFILYKPFLDVLTLNH